MYKDVEHGSFPFDHWIIPNFFDYKVAKSLENDFFKYNSDIWNTNYKNPLEVKRTITDWSRFPSNIYKVFDYFCSENFLNYIKQLTGITNLYPDFGLHGAGMHISPQGGKLNIHKDYSVHPKLGLQRKLNLIVYLNENWEKTWGGSLELWSNNTDTNEPLNKEKIIDPIFNTAVLFDTTQNSWHGLPDPITCPDTEFRKSIAFYWLTDLNEAAEKNTKALFVPTEEQKNNQEVLDLIKLRVGNM